jgi:hypothetical protein
MAKENGSGINPMFKGMIKSFIPMIKGKISEIDPFVNNLLKGQELLPGETSAKIILHTTEDGAQLLVCAFCEDTVVRVISKHKLSDFILNLIDKI